jgi:methionyl-tRNA synthetase
MTVYITAAIPYVNAAPHLGHALELVQADVLARHRRLRGQEVRLLTGTDDNAAKNVTAARAAGVDVTEFVDANAERFLALTGPLGVAPDDTVRTSRDPRHRAGVDELWRRCAERGDLYRRRYSGRYCSGCEAFRDTCDEHPGAVEAVSEENWFFRLSRYAGAVEAAIREGRLRIEPVSRRNEVLAFLGGEVADISVSRPAARSAGWGIPVPGDPDQIVYVWWDALANYLTTLTGADRERWWTGADERIHVIGKGITRFHAVYWPAQLLSAGSALPTALAVHPYLTVDGAKISKSSGTAADPVELVARYGTDAVRWWLAREVGPHADADFTEARLGERADRELVRGLGNLVNRTVSLVHRYRDGEVPAVAPDRSVDALPARVDAALHRFDLRAATDAIWAEVEEGNRTVERERPWELARDADARLDAVLATLVHRCRGVVAECRPFVPDTAARLVAQLGDGRTVGEPGPALPRLAAPAPR